MLVVHLFIVEMKTELFIAEIEMSAWANMHALENKQQTPIW